MIIRGAHPAAIRAPTNPAGRPALDSAAGAVEAAKSHRGLARNDAARLRLVLSVGAALFSFECAEPARAAVSCEHEIARAAARYDIPLAVFYAVGLNETGAKGRLQPYSMNIDGKAVFSPTLGDAVARFHSAKAGGARMIDIGCMQINHHYHGERFVSLEAMFDPARNIDYAARFLRELKQRERTWTMAVARYNAGPNNNPAQKRYVCNVLVRMVASGFGAWTESARNFCFGERVAKAAQ